MIVKLFQLIIRRLKISKIKILQHMNWSKIYTTVSYIFFDYKMFHQEASFETIKMTHKLYKKIKLVSLPIAFIINKFNLGFIK